jgi:glycosyltransferase involved in cell wall biosynthesis
MTSSQNSLVRVSILIPIYNSSSIILRTLQRLEEALLVLGVSYEIIFCDDGSTDYSREVLSQIESAKHPYVRCLYNDGNHGLGFTLRRLFQKSLGEIVFYCDCDLPFGEAVIKPMLEAMSKNDIVVASRYHSKARLSPMSRWLASWMYYFLCRVLFRISIRDIGSGTVAFKRKVIQELKINCDGFAVHAEIFSKSRRLRFSMTEIDFPHTGSVSGSFFILKHGPPTILDTILLWFSFLFRRQ